MESYRIENPQSETAMSIERNNTRLSADNGPVADHQPETGQKRPYEAPQLRRHAKLPVITAGSISEAQWQFNQDPT